MADTDLGKAYVQIVPSAKGIESAIQQTLGGPLQNTSTKLGQSLSSRIGSGFKSIGGAMTSYITKPALAAVTALGGATLFSGWKRMTQIDNAKVKLEAIGNSAKNVSRITNNALDSVKGTAYGMDAAMTTAASAVAAGIKPGKELTQYLTSVADAAAVAGVDMADMGSIFNKVATSGKAQNDVLRQMADAGIPIYQYLADQMGVTADEVFELAKAGKVGLSDFQAAVQNHIGGAAKEIGSKTITGAISNLKASISRIGANFLGSADDANSFAGKILPMLNNLMTNLEPIEAKAKEFGAAFADGFQKFIDVVSKIPLPVLAGIGAALVGAGPAIGIVSKLMTVLKVLGITINGPVIAVGALVGAIGIAYAKSETFRKAVNNLVKQVGPMLLPILKSLSPAFKQIANAVVSTATAIGNALAPVIEALTPAVKILVTLLGVRLKVAFTVVATVVETAGNAIKAVAAIIEGSTKGMVKIINTAIPAFKKFANNVKSTLSFKGITAKVSAVFSSVKSAITKPFQSVIDYIKGIVDKIKSMFSFKVSAPHVPLPHFGISPAGWKVGDLLKGSIPHLSVNWYAKGGIVDGATLIGAGENGAEAIVPLDPFWKRLENLKGNTYNNYITVNSDDGRKFAHDFMAVMEQEARAY